MHLSLSLSLPLALSLFLSIQYTYMNEFTIRYTGCIPDIHMYCVYTHTYTHRIRRFRILINIDTYCQTLSDYYQNVSKNS